MLLGEIIEALIGEVLVPVLFKLIRLPGALLAWAIWHRRTWWQVWNEGNWFAQGLAGLVIHVAWIGAWIARAG